MIHNHGNCMITSIEMMMLFVYYNNRVKSVFHFIFSHFFFALFVFERVSIYFVFLVNKYVPSP